MEIFFNGSDADSVHFCYNFTQRFELTPQNIVAAKKKMQTR